MNGIRNVLVPVDFSASSRKALDYGIGLARVFDAKVHVMHSYLADIGSLRVYQESLPADFVSAVRAKASEKLAEWSRSVEHAGRPVEMHLTGESPAESIAKLARAIDADIVVMGTRGLTGFKHVLLGSVAERTVRISPCPVLTIHPDDAHAIGPGDRWEPAG